LAGMCQDAKPRCLTVWTPETLDDIEESLRPPCGCRTGVVWMTHVLHPPPEQWDGGEPGVFASMEEVAFALGVTPIGFRALRREPIDAGCDAQQRLATRVRTALRRYETRSTSLPGLKIAVSPSHAQRPRCSMSAREDCALAPAT
jgi:hypothetical protein